MMGSNVKIIQSTIISPDLKYSETDEEITIRVNGIVASYQNADSLDCYEKWPTPTLIISDGPYGVSGYKGDLHSENSLDSWYEPHIREWSKHATPMTSLWFWNSEIGWATVHPILKKYGWEYKSCCIWDKGIGHIAGNCNTRTLTTLPVVTEVCVHYVKKPLFKVNNKELSMQEWMVGEWKRTKLPFKKANEACGVADAASRKWLSRDHLWYMAPSESFQKLVDYANENGDPDGAPYFSVNGKVLNKKDWDNLRAKFYCPMAKTNVWYLPQLKNEERLKDANNRAIHNNQKPLSFIQDIIAMSTDEGDTVWDPFGGLSTTNVASIKMKRNSYSAEIDEKMFRVGSKRLLLEANKSL